MVHFLCPQAVGAGFKLISANHTIIGCHAEIVNPEGIAQSAWRLSGDRFYIRSALCAMRYAIYC